MKAKKISIVVIVAVVLLTPFLFSADSVTQQPKPKPWNPTNALNQLPAMDRLWLMGEQMKQLVGDWANQQGDIGIDLLYYLQEPVRILTEEMKRIDGEHQKDVAGLRKEIAELRAEIQALKKAQGAAWTNQAAAPKQFGSTNSSESRPPPRSGGHP